MRAVECPCGEHLEGMNDTALLEAAKQHANEEHEGTYSDTDLRLLVDTSAYDTAAA
jgi:hypothetical protein